MFTDFFKVLSIFNFQMEFNFNINAILPQEICEVNSLLENCYKDKYVVKEKIQVKICCY